MRALLWAPLFLAAAGCGGLFETDSQPIQSYVLRVTPSEPQEGTPIRGTLRVSRPLTSPGLESERIVLVQSDHRLNYFTGSRWAGNLPDVIESLAVERLRGTAAWSVVQDSRSTFPGDYTLQITVRRFEADYTQNAELPVVRVAFDCILGRRSDREVLAAFSAEVDEPAPANRLALVVGVFEIATNKALAEIAQRAAESVRTSKAPLPP